MGLVRVLCLALYYGLARHLPRSMKPYSFGARTIRYALCRRILASCGVKVNVEHGADFEWGHDVRVGDHSNLGVNCLLVGPVTIGSYVMMAPDVMIYARDHRTAELDTPMIRQGYRAPAPVVIEDDVWLGARVIVLPGRRVGRGAVVAAGAVVTEDVPPYAVVAGNPARVVADRQARAERSPE